MRALLVTAAGLLLLYLLVQYRFRLINQLLAVQVLRKFIAIFLVNIPGVRERFFRQTFL
ncbi:hypothetical protein [Thalassobacillus pellis]|uniref:hypothetical protein n=1 Tax=Thalassobacillus pellis TaxID=748008 RepID=UPI00195FD415|nr:hypothetical protein [Thalassobacillus pellis]MBM7552283.1 RecA/RadA recombinase [Thalassobacillus pellis]